MRAGSDLGLVLAEVAMNAVRTFMRTCSLFTVPFRSEHVLSAPIEDFIASLKRAAVPSAAPPNIGGWRRAHPARHAHPARSDRVQIWTIPWTVKSEQVFMNMVQCQRCAPSWSLLPEAKCQWVASAQPCVWGRHGRPSLRTAWSHFVGNCCLQMISAPPKCIGF